MIVIIITSSTPAEITTTPQLELFPLLGILSLLLCIPCASSFSTELLSLLPP